MSLAQRTREAVRANPFLYEALRAGIVNYTAAARFLDLGADDEEAVVTALRRFAEDLPEYDPASRDARVSMQSELGQAPAEEALLTVGETSLAPGNGSLTGILAVGSVDAPMLRDVLGRLATAEIDVTAAGIAGESLLVVVERRDGPETLRAVEDALQTVEQ